jgi:hypothetical protein
MTISLHFQDRRTKLPQPAAVAVNWSAKFAVRSSHEKLSKRVQMFPLPSFSIATSYPRINF